MRKLINYMCTITVRHKVWGGSFTVSASSSVAAMQKAFDAARHHWLIDELEFENACLPATGVLEITIIETWD